MFFKFWLPILVAVQFFMEFFSIHKGYMRIGELNIENSMADNFQKVKELAAFVKERRNRRCVYYAREKENLTYQSKKQTTNKRTGIRYNRVNVCEKFGMIVKIRR